MAGTVGARQLTEADKARLIATLAANGGNVKLTARQLNLAPATVRRYRDRQGRGTGVSEELVRDAASDFVAEATAVRNMALVLLKQRIASGEIKASELTTAIGVLDDKIRLTEGLATARVEHTGSAFPPREELAAALGSAMQQAIQAAQRRDEEIVEAEIVEEEHPALPTHTAE